MFRILPLILVFQVVCLYHAYKNDAEQKWLWMILLLPFVGCMIYLYYHFFNQETDDGIDEHIAPVTKSKNKIEKLEEEASFSGTVTNKSLLADEYLKIGKIEKAIFLYESCLKGSHSDDLDLLMALVKAHYLNKDYPKTIKYGEQIENEKLFQKSEERVAYAWALNYLGEKTKAEAIFEDMDHQYSNYPHRFEFCNFLIADKRFQKAKEILNAMMEEIEHMGRPEKRSMQSIYNKIKGLYATI